MRYNVISADSHVVEPGDLWVNYIEAKHRAIAPTLQHQNDGDAFVYQGKHVVHPSAFSSAGRPLNSPKTWAEGVYPGGYDPTARLKDMASDGVDAEVVYPSVTLHVYRLISDLDIKIACFQAYNRWAHDFTAKQPKQLKAMAPVAIEDVERAVAMTREAKALGLAGIMITLATDDPNLYGNESLDPLWTAAQDADLPVSMHVVTTQNKLANLGSHIQNTLSHFDIQHALANMVFSGLFHRFPRLKVVSAENDGGWVPYFMERMDFLYDDPRRTTYQHYTIRGKGMKPSEYMHRACYFTFMRDATTVLGRHITGIDNLMWSSDYPHNDSTWPNSQKVLDRVFAGVPQTERQQITAGNAARLFGFN